MKTITIILRNQETVTLRLWREFTIFGERFGIHHTPTITGTQLNTWSVSHIDSGRVIVENMSSRNASEIEATRIINQFGKEKLIQAIQNI